MDRPRGLRLSGELDVETVESLEAALAPFVGDGREITLDLSELPFMDSMGVNAILRTAMKMEGRGRLVLRSPTTLVRNIFRVALGMHQLPNVDIDDASTLDDEAG